MIAFSGAMMPGTLLTVTISESTRRGPLAGPLLILGHAILEIALIAALLLGLAPLFTKEWFFIAIALAGGGILLWMGYGMFRALPSLSLTLEAEEEQRGNLVLTGILMSVANPYWIIWWATIGLGYIFHSTKYGWWGLLFFFVGHILADLVWYTMISTAVGKGRSFFSDRMYKGLIGSCAAFLVCFACYLLYQAFQILIPFV